MKLRTSLLLILASVSLFAADKPRVFTVAVFDFESKDENVRELGPKLATLINAGLSAEPNLITVERAEIEKALGEQEFGLSGSVSADTAAKVGRLTGAKILVTGRAFKVEKETIGVAKIIGTETSRVFGESAKVSGSQTITDLAEQLAEKIATVISSKGADLVPESESPEEAFKRVVAAVKSDKRPSILVQIPEKHFGALVVDPAAQTELGLYLQKAGFALVDDKSDRKPDIEITGEAFSAFGMRKGNLTSCKARIELKARERIGGRILLVDRETSVVVDLTEQTAAKTALENAAQMLATRLVPVLAR